MKKILLIVMAVFIICAGICVVFHNIYNFTPERWSGDREHRHLMIKDMEREYNIADMSENEIITLLGEPDSVMSSEEVPTKVLGYYIASGLIDPMFYEIYLKDGIVTKTQRIEH